MNVVPVVLLDLFAVALNVLVFVTRDMTASKWHWSTDAFDSYVLMVTNQMTPSLRLVMMIQ